MSIWIYVIIVGIVIVGFLAWMMMKKKKGSDSTQSPSEPPVNPPTTPPTMPPTV